MIDSCYDRQNAQVMILGYHLQTLNLDESVCVESCHVFERPREHLPHLTAHLSYPRMVEKSPLEIFTLSMTRLKASYCEIVEGL